MIQTTKTSGEGSCRKHWHITSQHRQERRGIKMTISKKLQKILAVTLMTSFLSTSFVMGVSEAAAARPNGGGRPPAQSQQIRRETQKGPSGHQMKAPMQRQSSGHHVRPAVHKSAPAQRMQSMHKGGPGHKAQPMMHKSGSIRHSGPGHKAQPMMHTASPGTAAASSPSWRPPQHAQRRLDWRTGSGRHHRRDYCQQLAPRQSP